MANKKIIYGIGAISVVATVSTAVAIPIVLKKKRGALNNRRWLKS